MSFSNSVTIPSDNLDDYDRHVKSYFDALQPEGPIEADLVRCLADTAWRLHRIKALEDNFMFLPLDVQAKSLSSMSMHSQRLSRQFERTEKHLRELQEIRKKQNDGLAFSEPEKAAAAAFRTMPITLPEAPSWDPLASPATPGRTSRSERTLPESAKPPRTSPDRANSRRTAAPPSAA